MVALEDKIKNHFLPNRVLTEEEYAKIFSGPKELRFKRGDLLPCGKLFKNYAADMINGIVRITQELLDKRKEEWRQESFEWRRDHAEEIKKEANTPENKKKKSDYFKVWRKKNPDKMRQFKKRYYSKPDKVELRKLSLRQRRKTDMKFLLISNQRCRLQSLLNGKKKSLPTQVLIGCSREFLMEWIEFQFNNGMNWSNKGKYTRKTPNMWEVDHFLPCNGFQNIVSSKEEQLICFNWTNLRPLWGIDNYYKFDTPPNEQEIAVHQEIVNRFLSLKFPPSQFI